MNSCLRLIFILLLLFNMLLSKTTNNKQFKEDLLVIMALDGEFNQKYQHSALLYDELFKKYPKEIYLKKLITLSFIIKDYKKIIQITKNNFEKFPAIEEYLIKEYIISSMILKNFKDALKEGKRLIKKYNTAENYSIVGDIYYRMGLYEQAVTYYESSYAKEQNIKTLLPLVDILYSYVNDKRKAISYLETFHREHGCFQKVCARLVRYYQEEKNVEGMVNILELMYNKYKAIHSSQQLLQMEELIIDMLEKIDIKRAIKFLEKHRVNDTKLLNLYGQVGEFKKALKMVRKKYYKTKDKSLLGQIAILEFEMAKDKKKVIKHVLANFELALQVSSNANYENYYGYLLIDYDLDIKKGLKLVKSALKKYPNNIAYIDSVAWGYFKAKQCDKAYYYMKKVVDAIGIENEEIKLHWDEIRNCKEGKVDDFR